MVYAISGCIIVSWDGRQGQFQLKCNYCGNVVEHSKHGFSMSGSGTSNHGIHNCSKCGKNSDIKIGKSS
jgi:hypothetical protein